MSVAVAEPPVMLRRSDGTTTRLPVRRWISEASVEEEAFLQRVTGPTLDIGCGPGRHVQALARRGVLALGVDVAPTAILLARLRGTAVLQRSVFERIPATGRWSCALLLDGNIGIGGDAIALLRRVSKLLRGGGRALVEVGSPGCATRSLAARLESGLTTSEWFPWMEVGADAIAIVAEAADFEVIDLECLQARWFVTLQHS